ncbi:MAG: hypothetical protein NXI21_13480 [Alphaproteobacteria bacterium]|nr:hypothetical protein [Alphaproteobacteria bacterium]
MPAQRLRARRRRAAGRLAPGLLIAPVLLMAAAAAAAGCAPGARWTNPEVPRDQWPIDRNACRQQAEDLAARQLDADRAANRTIGTTDALSDQFAVEDAKRLRQRLYERCLGARGYRLDAR